MGSHSRRVWLKTLRLMTCVRPCLLGGVKGPKYSQRENTVLRQLWHQVEVDPVPKGIQCSMYITPMHPHAKLIQFCYLRWLPIFPRWSQKMFTALATFPLHLQTSAGQSAISSPTEWLICSPAYWAKRTVAMGYQLQVQGRAPHFLSEVNPALGDIIAAIAIGEEINKLLKRRQRRGDLKVTLWNSTVSKVWTKWYNLTNFGPVTQPLLQGSGTSTALPNPDTLRFPVNAHKSMLTLWAVLLCLILNLWLNHRMH